MFPVQITKRKGVFVCQELDEEEVEPQQGTPEIMVSNDCQLTDSL